MCGIILCGDIGIPGVYEHSEGVTFLFEGYREDGDGGSMLGYDLGIVGLENLSSPEGFNLLCDNVWVE